MLDCIGRDTPAAREHVFDQIDAATWTVELVAEQHIGRTRRGAEPAMVAGPQYLLGCCCIRIGELFCREVGPHPLSTSRSPALGRAWQTPSKARQIGKGQSAGVDVKAAELGATMQLWKYLARVEQAVRVERAFQSLLVRQVAFVEHRSHQVALLDADPMLAGQDAADLNAELEDVDAKGLRALDLAGLVGVVKHERVKIAVAGVKDVGHREPVPLRERAYSGQDLGQARTRDGAVHAIVIGRDATDRREGGFASGPEGEPLSLVTTDPDFAGVVVARDRLDPADQMVDLRRRAVELDDQQRLDIERVAGLDKSLGRVDRRP